MSDEQNQPRELTPEGAYLGTLTKGAVGVVGKKNTPAMCLTFQVEDQVRTVYLYLSEAALPHTEKKLVSLGFNGIYEAPEFTRTERVELRCKHEEYEGKTMERWDLGFLPKPADKDTLSTLSAKFRARNAVPKPTTPPPGPPSRKPPPPKPKVESPNDDGKWDKNRAWDTWTESVKDEKQREKKFLAAVTQQEKASGYDEEQFDSADWCAVAELGELPF